MQATRIIAIRHGETAWNVDTRIQGHLDIPLNDTGLGLMRGQDKSAARPVKTLAAQGLNATTGLKDALILTKTNARSRVHRAGYMDYVPPGILSGVFLPFAPDYNPKVDAYITYNASLSYALPGGVMPYLTHARSTYLELGQGGMATVFLAEREDVDFQQRVAVKLLRRGPYSELQQQLFRRERQTLAALTHPAIARLIDGGVTDEGVPYLVMDHVDGLPITRHAELRNLDQTARLQLLCDVCRAVDAAHRQLVVHCDLKPSNIMVDAQRHAGWHQSGGCSGHDLGSVCPAPLSALSLDSDQCWPIIIYHQQSGIQTGTEQGKRAAEECTC